MATLGVVELSGSVRPTAAGECWKGPGLMVERDDLVALTATEAARRIRARSLTSVQLVTACLERIQERDPDLEAWVEVDAEAALAEAAVRDATTPQGLLHGVPVGIKDNADAVPFFTRFGSPIYRNNKPRRDAAHVAKLRAEGAVILGKRSPRNSPPFRPAPRATRGHPATRRAVPPPARRRRWPIITCRWRAEVRP
jgi:hypothetical protein